jgi:hypothetical protein
MVDSCTDVDLRRAQGSVSEERLHDVDGFTAADQLHRHRMPEGVRCCPAGEGYAGAGEPAAD